MILKKENIPKRINTMFFLGLNSLTLLISSFLSNMEKYSLPKYMPFPCAWVDKFQITDYFQWIYFIDDTSYKLNNYWLILQINHISLQFVEMRYGFKIMNELYFIFE